MKLFVFAMFVGFVGAQPRHEVVIGAAVNFTLSWQTNTASEKLHVCFGANVDDPSNKYIGLGFSEAGHGMNHSDLVVAHMGGGKPVVQTFFADLFPDAKGGYPNGSSTLEISKASLHVDGSFMQACFERSFSSGHYPTADGGRVIWAIGPLVAPTGPSGQISYHGKDGHDDTGTTQIHRSDECNPINWISGGSVCKTNEYCCPGGKCASPTKTACTTTNDCAAGQECCPLIGACVAPGSPCITPCTDLGAFCCPDAKHCLKPVRPGKFCTGAGSQGSCASGQVCCPLTNECVVVGEPCVPP